MSKRKREEDNEGPPSKKLKTTEISKDVVNMLNTLIEEKEKKMCVDFDIYLKLYNKDIKMSLENCEEAVEIQLIKTKDNYYVVNLQKPFSDLNKKLGLKNLNTTRNKKRKELWFNLKTEDKKLRTKKFQILSYSVVKKTKIKKILKEYQTDDIIYKKRIVVNQPVKEIDSNFIKMYYDDGKLLD